MSLAYLRHGLLQLLKLCITRARRSQRGLTKKGRGNESERQPEKERKENGREPKGEKEEKMEQMKEKMGSERGGNQSGLQLGIRRRRIKN